MSFTPLSKNLQIASYLILSTTQYPQCGHSLITPTPSHSMHTLSSLWIYQAYDHIGLPLIGLCPPRCPHGFLLDFLKICAQLLPDLQVLTWSIHYDEMFSIFTYLWIIHYRILILRQEKSVFGFMALVPKCHFHGTHHFCPYKKTVGQLIIINYFWTHLKMLQYDRSL